ncbi:Aminopeptidase 2 mitochondrial [Orbilia oligospora]|nr:Aminopeptidase 2 mitochondrial [Orbilia oligospora]KAF3097258.1 Aminopeptidase 2 mitochondrial [Orbilia oligospora]
MTNQAALLRRTLASLSRSRPVCGCPARRYKSLAVPASTTRLISTVTTPSYVYSSSSPSHSQSQSRTPLTTTTTRSTKPSYRFLSRQQARLCSSRRHNMCQSLMPGGDVASSIDVTQGREVLPKAIKPSAYKIQLEPFFEDSTDSRGEHKAFTFDGTVIVALDIVEDTTEVVVNSTEIKIHSAKLFKRDQEDQIGALSADDVKYNEDLQTATFDFQQTLKAGTTASLEIAFTGNLNNNMAGFYRSSYKDKDGKTKYLATTQMEPTDCRKAFPCFDEPGLKATFEVSLVAEPHLTCLSNMNEVDSSGKINGKTVHLFAPSPLMSTYLVAFIVGDLHYIETNEFRLPVRVYATSEESAKLGKFSLDLAAKTLDFYEKTFDSPYPLPKMDMVAIPDFSAGAMENWGLVTYRVVDLLFDETTSGASTKQRVAEVVQHELAHQWFGNLVTMDFWDGLWLNEGFATWMSWYSCNVFYPEWKVWESYVADNLQSALSLDSLRSSHPIEVPVKKISEINQIFDAISYSKGSCVLRMVSQYIGEDVFMEGIRKYLKKHAYKNTVTSDLWAALSEASGKDISHMMDVWTRHIGHPVVSVTETDNGIQVKQNRFLRTADVKPEEDETLYPIVLGLKTKAGVEDVLLTEREKEVKVDKEFYKINSNHSGIYRTLYPADRLAKLGEAAKQGLLTVEDRTGMVADAGALVASGHQKTSGFLTLVKGFTEEKEYVVWSEILNRVGTIRGAWVFEPTEVKDGLKAFNKKIVSKLAHELGWEFSEKDDHILQQFKALAFGSAGMSGDEAVVKAAQDMFAKFTSGDKSAIHPNLRSSVYAIVLKNGGRKEWEIVRAAYDTGANSDERNTALRALGRSKDPQCIKETLALSLSEHVKEQDIYLPLAGLRGHEEGITALWQWAKDSWDILEKKLPPGLGMLGSIVQIVTSSFTSEEQIADVEAFFNTRNTKGFDKGLAQALDSVKAKASWLKRDREDVKEWLKSEGYLN